MRKGQNIVAAKLDLAMQGGRLEVKLHICLSEWEQV